MGMMGKWAEFEGSAGAEEAVKHVDPFVIGSEDDQAFADVAMGNRSCALASRS